MNIDIVDVTSETILLSKEVADTIALSSQKTIEETGRNSTAETKKMALKECLPDILKEVANAAILSLNQKVWTGRIVSLNTKEIIINAGSDVGLRPGVMLEVFSKDECITSFHKQTYQLQGPKVGEIKVVSVQYNLSFAEPLNEGNFKPGQTVRIKD